MKKIQIGGHRKNSPVRGYAIVDDDTFEMLNSFKWCLNNCSYAVTRGKGNSNGKLILMHKLVLGDVPTGYEVDHISRNTLDNRHVNLRLASKQQNGMNRGKNKNNKSGYKGVVWLENNKKWTAGIKVDGKRKYLGLFDTVTDASNAYNKEAKKQFGSFAFLNDEKVCA